MEHPRLDCQSEPLSPRLSPIIAGPRLRQRNHRDRRQNDAFFQRLQTASDAGRTNSAASLSFDIPEIDSFRTGLSWTTHMPINRIHSRILRHQN